MSSDSRLQNYTPASQSKDDQDALNIDQLTQPQPLARPSTLFSARTKLIFAMALVAGALVYFAFIAFQGATVKYLSIEEAAALGPTPEGESVGVIGKLVGDSYVRSADGVTAHFSLKDESGDGAMRVTYDGEVGQVFFNEHSEIILQGRVNGEGMFNAEALTVRCPSKYLTEQERAELEAQNSGQPLPPPYQPDYFDRKT